jgi:hypothetical protein
MSPYRISALALRDGWIARRVDMVWGEAVVTYTRHRWYWTAWFRAWLWLCFHEWGSVQIKKEST